MILYSKIIKELEQAANSQKAEFFPRFFKAGKGEYAEGDKFVGIVIPDLRVIAKKYYKEVSLVEIGKFLNSKIHEYRLLALFMLVYKYEKSKDELCKTELVNLYLTNIKQVNNWDLVDLSCYKLLGDYLKDKDKGILYDFAKSNDLWKQRIAIITTMAFIKKYDFQDTINIAGILVNHKHDLIHKAVGWMLREVGKRNREEEEQFLKIHYQTMPRTMLRYAIEKFDEETRLKYLKG
ncbi:DNA alkylation repair protein [Candidatus Dojkabacteria bacterium]|nr:DNA alkylation repair protein [Candidatus Dojkabacteria bacterium]